MSLARRLLTYFNIRPSEVEIVLLMLLYSGAAGIAINYYFTAASSLFLSVFSIEILPYTILAAGIAVFITQTGYTYLQQYISADQMTWVTLSFIILMLLGIRIGLFIFDASWLLFVVIVLFRVMYMLLSVGFWVLANRLFTLTQSKRLFALIGAGDVISVMLASFMLPVVVSIIGTVNLFFVSMANIAICLGCVLYILHRYQQQLAPTNIITKPPTDQNNDQTLFRNDYIVLIFLTYLMTWVANYALDFVFYGQLQTYFEGQPEAIAGFMGIFFGFVQLTNFVLKFFISGRLLIRYGLNLGILCLPIAFTLLIMLAGGTGITISMGFAFFMLIMVTKYIEEILRSSFSSPAMRIFYQPLSDNIRSSTVTFVEGTGYALTALIAGGILVFFSLTNTYTPLRIVYLMILMGGIWIMCASRLSRKYPIVLRRALQKRTISRDVEFFQNQEALTLLTEKLQSTRPDEVIYAFMLLAPNYPDVLMEHLDTLLQHHSEDVRLYTLHYIEQYRISIPDPLKLIAIAEHDESSTIREAALIAYHAPSIDDKYLKAYVDSKDRVVQRGALISLLKYGNVRHNEQGQKRLGELIASDNADDRQLVAEIFAKVDVRPYYPLVIQLLRDKNLDVQKTMLSALQCFDHPDVWELVIEKLYSPQLRTTTLNTIANSGESALPILETALYNSIDPSFHIWLVRTIARIGGHKAINILEANMNREHALTRIHILRALDKCGYRSTSYEEIHKRVNVEQQQAEELMACLFSFSDDPLLYDALMDAFVLTQERILLLLSFYYDLANVHKTMFDKTTKQRDYAIEVLNVTLPQPLRSTLMRLFEHTTLEQRNTIQNPSQTPASLLNKLIADDSQIEWLRAVATRHSGVSQIPSQIEVISLMIDRVKILKTVTIFKNIPDYILAHLANQLDEVTVAPDETIIHKNESGDAMYIIVKGRARAHDGDMLLNYLEERDVFGEMAVLDTEPRVASITADMPTHLFCLSQEALYEVMSDYPEVSRTIIRVILGYLRNRIADLTHLRRQVAIMDR